MQAVIALILANLPSILEAGKAGYDFVTSVRSAAQQAGEWTEFQEAEFQSKIEAQAIDPAWRIDNAAPVTDQAKQPQVSQANVASVPAVICPVCSKELIADHPANCNCVTTTK